VAQFKVVFTLDEDDVAYYRSLYRQVRKQAKEQPAERIIEDARAIVQRVRASKKTPHFVTAAIEVLADLVDLIQDNDYAAPISVRDSVLAALGYFSNPQDLVPDHVPGIGFLDDAIMIRFVEEEFRHELWGYRKFRKRRDSLEQRPWSHIARSRLQIRLDADRKAIRAEIQKREAKDELARKHSGRLSF
jgi:uncharacterized membrane protein YkvA (DUF1232 family)